MTIKHKKQSFLTFMDYSLLFAGFAAGFGAGGMAALAVLSW